MSLPQVPVDSRTLDWPRRIAGAINYLLGRNDALTAATDWSALDDYADDTAAASGGVAIGELYRTGSAVKVRVA